MNWKNHLLFNSVLLGALVYFGILLFELLLIPVWLICSLLPDLDSKTSKIRKIFNYSIATGLIVSGYLHHWLAFVVMLVIFVLVAMRKHRGKQSLHSVVGVVILLPLILVGMNLFYAGLYCLVGHFLADWIGNRKSPI